MSVLRLLPVLPRPHFQGMAPVTHSHCCFTRSFHFSPLRCQNTATLPPPVKHKLKSDKLTPPSPQTDIKLEEKLRINYHNGSTSAAIDLQSDSPPILFIRKYQEVIDTRHVIFNDELNELERRGDLSPEQQSLALKKMKLIQDAVSRSKSLDKLSKHFVRAPRRPDPILSGQVSEGQVHGSVFANSDFEVISGLSTSPIATNTVQQQRLSEADFQLAWSAVDLNIADLSKYYLTLSKARLTLLVCMTATAGYAMAPGTFHLYTAACATLGTAMASAAANTINQILEVPFDSQMNRTKNRVLVRLCLSSFHAFAFACTMAGAGTILLYTQVNGLAALLAALNLVLYTCVYTPLKRVSICNTWVGSIVGAIPPLIGWASATGSLEPGAFILAGILFAWQFPHFNSLSWNLRPDYSKAGYRMMSVTEPDLCRRVALRYSAACVGVCTAAPLLDLTSWAFAIDSLPLNLYLTYLSYRFYQKADSNSSRKLFRFTLIHLPLLMTLMLISKKDTSHDDSHSAVVNAEPDSGR